AAAEVFSRAVGLQPSWQGWFNLGNVLLDLGRADDAAKALEAACLLRPADAGVRLNLGMALWRAGRLADAEARLREVAASHPDSAAAGNLGNFLTATGRLDDAVAVYRQALAARPDDPTLLLNLGLALHQAKQFEAAETVLARLTARAPDMAEAWNALGSLLLRVERLDEAESAFARALALKPDLVDALNNMGNVAATRGDAAGALAYYRAAHQRAPHDAAVHSNLLFQLTHMAGVSAAEVFAEHRRFGILQEAEVAALPPVQPPLADGRLRVGYVSPDFCNHAVTFWFEAVLAHHDPQHFEIFCYHTGPRHDAVTERLRALVPHWRTVNGVSSDSVAAMVRADGIHILVDLAGHSANNGLPVFLRKPAPIQATFLGYPNTTGLTRMDYRLAHAPTILGDAQDRYTERLELMTRPAVFRPPADAPAVPPLPMVASGRPRFGSFNKAQKIGAPVYALWGDLLARIPGATLLMVVPGGDTPQVRDEYRAHFTGRGIAAERIDTVGLRDLNGFLGLVGGVDVALDPFPYGGGTTTLMTLWMGVPIICMYGEGPADGVSAGMMNNVGLSHLVAKDAVGYLAAAQQAVADADALAAVRASLRDRMRQTFVMEEAEFVAELEGCYHSWWQRLIGTAAAGENQCAE
ncbi:MAG TPA: tetratricopeptide repeat protein, partial [Magnetospirillum sp.]|nr:tetratricopeptide repeat protein [Magnetospirillum sp.]